MAPKNFLVGIVALLICNSEGWVRENFARDIAKMGMNLYFIFGICSICLQKPPYMFCPACQKAYGKGKIFALNFLPKTSYSHVHVCALSDPPRK